MRVDGFLETKLLDSAPLLFPSIKVIRHPGVLSESGSIESTSARRESWPGDVVSDFHGTPMAAFRCEGLDSLRVQEVKTGWDQLASVFVQNKKVVAFESLRKAVWMQQRLHWPRLDAFFCVKEWLENHVPTVAHSVSYREARFFTRGVGRIAIRLFALLGLTVRPSGAVRPQVSADPVNRLWKSWQQTLLRGPGKANSEISRHNQVA
jgi:hypothetical protein